MASSLNIGLEVTSNCKNIDVTDNTGEYNAITNPGGYGAPNITIDDVDEATITVTNLNDPDTEYEVDVFDTLPNTDDEEFRIENTDIGLSSSDTITDSIYMFSYCLSGNFAITDVNTGTKTFTISGNRSGVFSAGEQFAIEDSTGNDGNYTVVSITYSAPNTLIVVSETIPDATVDGNILFNICTTKHEALFCNANACYDNKLKDISITGCQDCNNNKINIAIKIFTYIEAMKNQVKCGKVNHALTTLNYITELCGSRNCNNC